MRLSSIPVPDIYTDSADFRFFLAWMDACLSKVQYDTENLSDLYDPLKCPANLLWMLADTIGYKFDDRLPIAFNRMVILYFMSMIRNRGSKDGMTLAAALNLAQFNVIEYGKQNDELYNRLEDTTIPVNAAYVNPHVEEGYIDVVYFSNKTPVDACIEYVRPVGMYCFQNYGVRFDTSTHISVDARLTNDTDLRMSIGPTHVGKYAREDYARTQSGSAVYSYDAELGRYSFKQSVNKYDGRRPVWSRNTEASDPSYDIDPGYRSIYSLQLANNAHIVKSLISNPDDPKSSDSIFSVGILPENVHTVIPDSYIKGTDPHMYNLQYDIRVEQSLGTDVYTIEESRSADILNPRPAVNPPMFHIGDAISMNPNNSSYTKVDDSGTVKVITVND